MIINDKNLAVKHFASKDKHRLILNSILLKQDGSTVATDGRILAIISPEKTFADEDYPEIPDHNFHPLTKDHIIPIESIEKIKRIMNKKMSVPILEKTLKVSEIKYKHGENEKILTNFLSTDLETAQEVKIKNIDGEYPDINSVIPDNDYLFKTSVSIQNLSILYSGLEDFFSDVKNKIDCNVKIFFYGERKPMVLKAHSKTTDQDIKIINMPVRLNEEQNEDYLEILYHEKTSLEKRLVEISEKINIQHMNRKENSNDK